MASVSNTCSGSSGSKYTIRLYYVLNSQNISANTSNITVYATLQRNDGYANSAYNGYESQNHTVLTVAGANRVDKNFILDTRNSRVQELSRWTGNISHNADGTKAIALAASFTTSGTNLTGGSVSTSWTLPAIPRKSSFTVSPSTATIGNAVTVTVDPASSSFTHTASITMGSRSVSLSFAAGETSKSVTIPMEWCSGVPSAVSASAAVSVTTRSGSTALGTATGTLTLRVPSSVVPSAGTLSVARVDGEVPADWGIYVQGYSKAALALSGAAGAYGSSIRSYSLSGGGYSSTAASFTTGTLNTAGTVVFTGMVTDSRGRSASVTRSITVQAYSPPGFGGVSVYRCDAAGTEDPNGEYAAIQADYTYSALGGKNTCAGAYRLARTEGGGSALTGSLASGTKVIVPNVSGDYSWTATLTLTDGLNTTTYATEISTAATTLDFLEGGNGVAVGKVAEEENLLDVAFDARFRGDVTFDSPPQGVPIPTAADLGIISYIVEWNGNTNGFYVKYSNGYMVCYGKKAVSVTFTQSGTTDFAIASATVNYPVAFAGTPTVTFTTSSSGYVSSCLGGQYADRFQARFTTIAGTSPSGITVQYIAVGAWT